MPARDPQVRIRELERQLAALERRLDKLPARDATPPHPMDYEVDVILGGDLEPYGSVLCYKAVWDGTTETPGTEELTVYDRYGFEGVEGDKARAAWKHYKQRYEFEQKNCPEPEE